MSAWILLRGLTRETRHWAAMPDRLRDAGLEGDILCIDLPGGGRYVHERAPASLAATTDFVRHRIRLWSDGDGSCNGQAPPYRIVALSLGAMVAIDWAQRFPGEIERLVLINTSLGGVSGPWERMRPGAWLDVALAAWAWRGRKRRKAEAAIHALTCRRIDSRDVDLATWVEIYETAPPTRANALRQLWAAARFRAAPGAPPCPTLVLASCADALVHPVCSAKLAARWGAPLMEHPWAGHDLAHDDPAWLAETIAAWVGNALAVAMPPTSA